MTKTMSSNAKSLVVSDVAMIQPDWELSFDDMDLLGIPYIARNEVSSIKIIESNDNHKTIFFRKGAKVRFNGNILIFDNDDLITDH